VGVVFGTKVPGAVAMANAGAATARIESSRRAVMATVNIFLFICIFYFSPEFIFFGDPYY
jgi:hypothetical protein